MECSLRSLTEAKSLEREEMLRRTVTILDAARRQMRRERPHPLTHRASRIPWGRSRLTTHAHCALLSPSCSRGRKPARKAWRRRRDSVPHAKVEASRGASRLASEPPGKDTILSLSFPFLSARANEAARCRSGGQVKIARIGFCTSRIGASSPDARATDLLSRTCNHQPCESHRAKKFKSGGSDPTFLRPSRPKVSRGRSRPPAQKAVPFLFSTVIRSSQTAMKGSTEHELRPFHRAQE